MESHLTQEYASELHMQMFNPISKGVPIAKIVWTQKWNDDTSKLYRDNITDEALRVLTRLSTNNYNTTLIDNTYTFNPFIIPVIGKRIS